MPTLTHTYDHVVQPESKGAEISWSNEHFPAQQMISRASNQSYWVAPGWLDVNAMSLNNGGAAEKNRLCIFLLDDRACA
eukprot:1140327-Pelagomonas_calceolata.AAC.6